MNCWNKLCHTKDDQLDCVVYDFPSDCVQFIPEPEQGAAAPIEHKSTGSEKIHQCAWVYNDDCFWATECGTAFCFTNDGPHENRYQFCPNCGRVIVT